MSSLRHNLDIVPQELFASSATQLTDLGAQVTTGDGRYFRYCSVGSTTALVAGSLYQSTARNATAYQNIGVGAVGTNVALFTTGSNMILASNELSGGYVSVRSGSGSGFNYKIKANTAASTAVSTITLDDPLQVGWLANSTILDFYPSPFQNVIIAPTALSGIPIGVAVSNGTINGFGWLQTRGPASVLNDATVITVGNSVSPSTATAGSVTPAKGSLPIVGTSMTTTTASVQNLVFLTLE